MKTIGLIGGMSWESTRIYYDAINVEVRTRLGGLHSAKCILHSLDFAPIAEMQAAGRWEEAGQVLAQAGRDLERAGAEVLGLCTNTMHKVADHITAATSIPFVHIADATAGALHKAGRRAPYLMATRFTMEQDFYTGRLQGAGLRGDRAGAGRPGRNSPHHLRGVVPRRNPAILAGSLRGHDQKSRAGRRR